MPEIHLKAKPRDLIQLAQDYADNPSIVKQIRRSGAMSSMRRGVHAPGASAATLAGKAAAHALGRIPIPIVDAIAKKALDSVHKALRKRNYQSHLVKPNISQADKIKFELKTLGDTVAGWDNDRWKITHAIEQVNKATAEVKDLKSGPCDAWVRLMAKRIYLRKRILKLRVSVESVMAICKATLEWLDAVEQSVDSDEDQLKPIYTDDVRKLAQFAAAHTSCDPMHCMHGDKAHPKSPAVPAADLVSYLITAGVEASQAGNPHGAAVASAAGEAAA